MLYALYAIGGFLVGLLTVSLVLIRLTRQAKNEAFKRFWF